MENGSYTDCLGQATETYVPALELRKPDALEMGLGLLSVSQQPEPLPRNDYSVLGSKMDPDPVRFAVWASGQAYDEPLHIE